jgi:site-specific recombinase XerD
MMEPSLEPGPNPEPENAVGTPPPPPPVPASTHTLDQLVEQWLAAKGGLSGSRGTLHMYGTTMQHFRAFLQSRGVDLDGEPKLVARLGAEWAARPTDGRIISAATYNQHLVNISSFYRYAIRYGLLEVNPVDRIERRKVGMRNAARPFDSQEVAEKLAAIDCTTLRGLRDYTLLLVAFSTGRRRAELANLRRGHIQVSRESVVITWVRCKGGKVMRDHLESPARDVFLAYLDVVSQYWLQNGLDTLITIGAMRCAGSLKAELMRGVVEGMLSSIEQLPVWLSLAGGATGNALTVEGISDICQKRLGTSKVHATRHTFAVLMEQAGAKIMDISRRLGHDSYYTTALYLERLHNDLNPYGQPLQRLLGVEAAPVWKQHLSLSHKTPGPETETETERDLWQSHQNKHDKEEHA